MKLYICWGTFQTPRPGGHPCANAYNALRDAGHNPEVVKVHGLGVGPKLFQHITDGRREVEKLTGSTTVPVLVTDSGDTNGDSKAIVAWAEAHPASTGTTA